MEEYVQMKDLIDVVTREGVLENTYLSLIFVVMVMIWYRLGKKKP
jgi:hypothetical protein